MGMAPARLQPSARPPGVTPPPRKEHNHTGAWLCPPITVANNQLYLTPPNNLTVAEHPAMTRPEPVAEHAGSGSAALQAGAAADDAYVIRCGRKTHIEEWDGRLLGMECTHAQAAALEQRVLAAAQQDDFSLLHEGFCLSTLLPIKGGQLKVLEGLQAANQRAEEVWQELQQRQQVATSGKGEQVRRLGCGPLPSGAFAGAACSHSSTALWPSAGDRLRVLPYYLLIQPFFRPSRRSCRPPTARPAQCWHLTAGRAGSGSRAGWWRPPGCAAWPAARCQWRLCRRRWSPEGTHHLSVVSCGVNCPHVPQGRHSANEREPLCLHACHAASTSDRLQLQRFPLCIID